MAKWKKRTIIISVVVLAVALLLLTIKFAWRIIPGYYFCDDPDRGMGVSVKDDQVNFSLSIANLGHFYDGHKYEIKDGTMFIGVKTIFLLGKIDGDGIMFTVPTEEKVEKIVLCGKGKERVIYPKEE